MKKNIFSVLAAGFAALSALLSTSCQDRQGWTIAGTIENSADSTIYIEEPSGPAWILIDSVRPDRDGHFEYRAVSAYLPNPTVYRLRMGNKVVYFPVQQASDIVNIAAKADNMEKVHTLSGSAAAVGFTTVDSLINDAVVRLGAKEAVNDSSLIANLGNIIIADSTCIVSYYIIKHPVENYRLFTPDNSRKVRLLGAAATRYQTLRPNDPRGKELSEMHANARQARRGKSGAGSTMEATLSGRPDVDFVRYDVNGNAHDLNKILDRGAVTVVNMVRYDDANSPANTAALGEVYQQYKDRGLVIYQIGFDPNEAHWRQNAVKMPWITVYNRSSDPADILVAYNANPIDGGPVSFVFNKSGELMTRVSDPAKLAAAVEKAF